MKKLLTMKIKDSDGNEFEIVDYTRRTVTIRSLKKGEKPSVGYLVFCK